jgi:hypothetical protein
VLRLGEHAPPNLPETQAPSSPVGSPLKIGVNDPSQKWAVRVKGFVGTNKTDDRVVWVESVTRNLRTGKNLYMKIGLVC